VAEGEGTAEGVICYNGAMPGGFPQPRATSPALAAATAKAGRSYAERLDSDPYYAMNEGDSYFQGQGAVHETLRRISRRLDELGISYAVAGGLALFNHGFRRFTEDVDILISSEGLKEVHRQLGGLGYVPPFAGSKNLRDAATGVKIDFLISGQFPGDGKPKPVAFPAPENVAVERSGIRYVNLATIIELKLASGISNPERMKDLADVQELIKILALPRDFGAQLSEYVRPKYFELWTSVHPSGKRFVKLWDAGDQTPEAASTLAAMEADGVMVDRSRRADEKVLLVTGDADIAKKYDMHDEGEMWPEGGEVGNRQ
jgi:hypothetical protein